MPKKVGAQELDAILQVLELFSEGATLEQLNQALNNAYLTRTLLRRLNFLIKEGQIVSIGKTRYRHYRLKKPMVYEIEEESLLLSSHTNALFETIQQPIQARKPVGYNRNFLNNYYPNKTFYLPKHVCERLTELGKTDGKRAAGTYAREIFNRLLIDLSWNSSRLEGNSYSLLETERLLELQEAAEGKEAQESQMILNHKAAIEFLVDNAAEIDMNRQTIFNLHALLSDNLLKDSNACGRLRTKAVVITKSVYHPLIFPDLINEYFEQILDIARAIRDPFEQAFFIMVHIPYLQPFEDVNKRVSRLAANIPLIRMNLAPLSFIDVPQKTYIQGLLAVYELNDVDILRDLFIWAYERSCAFYSATCQVLGDPDPLRLRYRKQIHETVGEIVRNGLNKPLAVAAIRLKAAQLIPQVDQAKFIEIVEVELRSLHEGNFARYKLRHSEFLAWMTSWK